VRQGSRRGRARSYGSFAMKLPTCRACAFYEMVRREEGAALVNSASILEKLR